MASAAERITAAIERTGMTRAKLARELGITPQAIAGWEKTGTISKENLLKLADKARLDPEQIVTGTGRRPIYAFGIKTDEEPLEDGDVTVDVADIALAAGDGVEAPEFVETKYRHTFRAAWLAAQGIRRHDAIKRCSVNGRSMEPVLYDGDTVTINTDDKDVKDDSVYALVIGRSLKVKRLSFARDGSLHIKSDNPEWPTEVVPRDELNQIHIIGRVFDKSGSGGLRK